MAVAISEALTASVTQQSDVSDGMFELLTDLVLAGKQRCSVEPVAARQKPAVAPGRETV